MGWLRPFYIAVIGVSFFVSLISFRKNFPFHLKFFSVLLGLTFLVELYAVYGLQLLQLNYRNTIYNRFMLIIYCSYTIYYRQLLPVKRKAIADIILLILIITWLVTPLGETDSNKWNTFFSVVGPSCTIILCVMYCAQLLSNSEPVNLWKHSEFIIAAGMLIFYTYSMLYLGAINFLVNKNNPLAKDLLAVLRIFIVIMYSLFLYAFICRKITRK